MKHGLCVIGYGGMGGWHVNHALNSDVVELIGVYDIKEERNLAAQVKGIMAYRSLEEVLADPKVEIVTIAIPNDEHESVAIRCMEAGKNIISEKPVTLSVASLDRMTAVSVKNSVKFSVHQNRRWDVDYLAVKELFENDTIGRIFNIESRIHGSRGIPSDWRGVKKFGGGMLYDWGVHLIDQVMMLFNAQKLVSVFCEFDHITNKEVDDGFKLTLHFDTGSRAYIEVGTYNFIAMPRFYIQGERGTGLLTDWRENCHVTECFAWYESDVIPVQTAAGLTKTMAPRDEITTKSYDLDRPISDVHDYYRNFCSAVEGKGTQLVTHAQMRRVLKVIEAAFASVERNQVISYSE
ncbi:MAG: Gfo/Idh/MocA family oxidoreductase [Christensenella sp.]|nr:Gfo/Idh/MocA family oxidoreductase [Christensenella sp.]